VQLLHGDVDGVVADCFQLWDHAPWILLVEEAGGRYTSSAGDPLSHGGGVYSNRALHEQLIGSLAVRRR
jgi:histidinol-phosphatase